MKPDYDLIVIGGGAAGLTAAGLGVTVGAKTLLVEADRLGGDCTWTGCVPSKTLLKAAKVAQEIRTAGKFGLTDQPVDINFRNVLEHVRRVRDEIYEDADAPPNLERLGIEVVSACAAFVDKHTIRLSASPASSGGDAPDDRTVSGRYFVIATGAKPFVPPIPGLDSVRYLTNETLFELTEQPRSLAIIGGGPIGCEMAQSFARLGTEVTVIDQADRVLTNDDPDLARVVQNALSRDGVEFVLGAEVKSAENGTGVRLNLERDGSSLSVSADALLVATGRRANYDSLNLEAAGVETGKQGITVDDRCRTNIRHIFAVGDVTGRYQFTHMSEHMAKVAATNALLKLPMKIDKRNVPWVTYTDPELAHVGRTVDELRKAGTRFRTYTLPFSKIDRAVTEGCGEGIVKVHARERDGKIYGVDIVGARAGDLIGECALAMRNGVSLRKLSDTIHPYPTYALGVRRAADQWYVRKQSPTLVKWIKRIFGYRGPVLEFGEDEVV